MTSLKKSCAFLRASEEDASAGSSLTHNCGTNVSWVAVAAPITTQTLIPIEMNDVLRGLIAEHVLRVRGLTLSRRVTVNGTSRDVKAH